MKNFRSYWNYIPIIVCLALGYVAGGYLTFGIKFLNVLPGLKNELARFCLILFGMGVLGATTYCTRFWSRDMEEAVYAREDLLPHIYDFFGYLATLIGGGITGVLLYLIVKTGIFITTSPRTIPELNFAASIIIAYCGGLFHFRIQNILAKLVSKMLREQENRIAESAQMFDDKCEPRDPMGASSDASDRAKKDIPEENNS